MRDGRNDLPLCLSRLQVHLNVFRTEAGYVVTSLSTVPNTNHLRSLCDFVARQNNDLPA